MRIFTRKPAEKSAPELSPNQKKWAREDRLLGMVTKPDDVDLVLLERTACPVCKAEFGDTEKLIRHLNATGH